jgi:hypothetical protein
MAFSIFLIIALVVFLVAYYGAKNKRKEDIIVGKNEIEKFISDSNLNVSKRIQNFTYQFEKSTIEKEMNCAILIDEADKKIAIIQLGENKRITFTKIYKWSEIISYDLLIDNQSAIGGAQNAAEITGILAGGAVGYLAAVAIGSALKGVMGTRTTIHTCTLVLDFNKLSDSRLKLQILPSAGITFNTGGIQLGTRNNYYEKFEEYIEDIANTMRYILGNAENLNNSEGVKV